MNEGYDIGGLLTDEKLEVEGVWRDLPGGAKVKVARWQNDDYQRMAHARFKANRVILEQDDEVSRKVMNDIIIEVMAHTVLRDVYGFKAHPRINGGAAIEKYTPEIGKQLLSIKDFREKIKGFSEDIDAYLLKQETAAGN